MKRNILAENMIRFNTKNLNEYEKKQGPGQNPAGYPGFSKDDKNYQPSIELVNSKNDGSGYPTITVKIDGGNPFDIEFDDHEVVDDHGYEKAIWLFGSDEGGGEWGMEGSKAWHGEIEDYDIDTLEQEVN